RLLTSGTIALTAANMVLDTTGQIGGTGVGVGSASNIILTGPSNTTIGIAGGAGTLALAVNELSTMRATNVRIGNTSAGNMAVNAWTPVAAFAANGTLTLASTGTITQGGIINLATSASKLLIRGGAGNVTLTLAN